jgi:hypothetical protein
MFSISWSLVISNNTKPKLNFMLQKPYILWKSILQYMLNGKGQNNIYDLLIHICSNLVCCPLILVCCGLTPWWIGMLEIVMHSVLPLNHSTSPTNVKKMGIKANNKALSQDYSPLYNYSAGFANQAMNERPSLNWFFLNSISQTKRTFIHKRQSHLHETTWKALTPVRSYSLL